MVSILLALLVGLGIVVLWICRRKMKTDRGRCWGDSEDGGSGEEGTMDGAAQGGTDRTLLGSLGTLPLQKPGCSPAGDGSCRKVKVVGGKCRAVAQGLSL